MAAINNKSKVLDTRIALKIDSELNWKNNGSEKPLMPGEIAMSYGGAEWDQEHRTYRYKDFKFKVGARDTTTGKLLKWNELQEISLATLDPELVQQIIEAVEQYFEGQYTKKSDFESFAAQISSQVVTDWQVDSDEKLYLLRDFNKISF